VIKGPCGETCGLATSSAVRAGIMLLGPITRRSVPFGLPVVPAVQIIGPGQALPHIDRIRTSCRHQIIEIVSHGGARAVERGGRAEQRRAPSLPEERGGRAEERRGPPPQAE
jgi:hypothetical protein